MICKTRQNTWTKISRNTWSRAFIQNGENGPHGERGEAAGCFKEDGRGTPHERILNGPLRLGIQFRNHVGENPIKEDDSGTAVATAASDDPASAGSPADPPAVSLTGSLGLATRPPVCCGANSLGLSSVFPPSTCSTRFQGQRLSGKTPRVPPPCRAQAMFYRTQAACVIKFRAKG